MIWKQNSPETVKIDHECLTKIYIYIYLFPLSLCLSLLLLLFPWGSTYPDCLLLYCFPSQPDSTIEYLCRVLSGSSGPCVFSCCPLLESLQQAHWCVLSLCTSLSASLMATCSPWIQLALQAGPNSRGETEVNKHTHTHETPWCSMYAAVCESSPQTPWCFCVSLSPISSV